LLICRWSWCHGDENIDFVINKTSKAKVSLTGSKITFEVKTNDTTTSGHFEIDAEAKLNLKFEDFNFDGNFDFDVWYVDEGMGVYTVHRVFVFDPSSKVFYEIFPRCGDQFFNLEISREKRVLYSTFFINNKPKRCSTRFVLR
jgi:hypothetical protein